MSTRRLWISFTSALRAFVAGRDSFKTRVKFFTYCHVKNYRMLLVLPAAGLMRSLTLFKKSEQKEAKNAPEPQLSSAQAEVLRVISKAESLYSNNQYEELVSFLGRHAHLENDEILWRYARALSDMSKLSSDRAAKKELIFQAFEAIKRALAANDNNFACHKWYAILLDKTAEYEGTKARISNAYIVKEHFMKASQLNPHDATTLYTLGVWCFLFADMPWYQRKIAAALFASPPTSTYEEALNYFLRAEDMDPHFYSKNLLMLGKTYSRLGNKKLASLYLSQAWDYPVKSPDDREAHAEAGEWLNKLGIKPEEQKNKEGNLTL